MSLVNWYRIKSFIGECEREGIELSDVMIYDMHSMDSFPRFIPSISRLVPEDKKYVLNVLDRKYLLNNREREIVLGDSLELVNEKETFSNFPNLPKLYKNSLPNVYAKLVSAYKNDEVIHSSTGVLASPIDYMMIMTKDYADFDFRVYNHKKFLENILRISPSKADILMNYSEFEDALCKASVIDRLADLPDEDWIKLNKMNSEEFKQYLDFIISDMALLEARIKLFSYYQYDQDKYDFISKIPNFILEYSYFDEKCLDIFYESRKILLPEFEKIPFWYQDYLMSLFTNGLIEKFTGLEIALILGRLREGLENIQEEKGTSLYCRKMDFLLGGETVSNGYALGLPTIDHLKATLNFIKDVDNLDLLDAKMEALSNIEEDVKKSSVNVDIGLYQAYLSYLDSGSKNKSIDRQINQVRSRSKYMNENYLSTIYDKLNVNDNYDKLMDLLYSVQDEEQMRLIYHFITVEDQYNEEVTNLIISHLIHAQNIASTSRILQVVESDAFRNKSVKKQKAIVEMLPGEEEVIDSESLTFSIPDYRVVSHLINNSKNGLTFVEAESKVKIKVYKNGCKENS